MSQHPYQDQPEEARSGEEQADSLFDIVLHTSVAGGSGGVLATVIWGKSRQELINHSSDIFIFIFLVITGYMLGIFIGHRVCNERKSELNSRFFVGILLALLASLVPPIGYIVLKMYS